MGGIEKYGHVAGLRFLLCALLAAASFATMGASERIATIAHRGTGQRGSLPENTLPAFERAIDEGADLIELDVRLTADGVPIVLHDQTLERTTDCAGCVGEFTADQLASCRATQPGGNVLENVSVPTLAETLDRVDGRVGVNIEIKPDCCDGQHAGPLVDAVLAAIDDAPAGSRFVVSSFSLAIVSQIEERRPELDTALLLGRGGAPHGTRAAAERGVDAINVNHRGLTAEDVRAAHDAGLRVNAWTVNNPRRIHQLAEMDVDGIITDHPGATRETLVRIYEPDDATLDDDDARPDGSGDDDDVNADAPGVDVGCGEPAPGPFARY